MGPKWAYLGQPHWLTPVGLPLLILFRSLIEMCAMAPNGQHKRGSFGCNKWKWSPPNTQCNTASNPHGQKHLGQLMVLMCIPWTILYVASFSLFVIHIQYPLYKCWLKRGLIIPWFCVLSSDINQTVIFTLQWTDLFCLIKLLKYIWFDNW